MGMTRRERLMRSLRGEPVDRPPVSFYEINGFDEDPDDPDPYNIYNHPSWRPAIELANARSDRIVRRTVQFGEDDAALGDRITEVTEETATARLTATTVRAGGVKRPLRDLTRVTRRDRDTNTVWTVKHLLQDRDDLLAYLELPLPDPHAVPDLGELKETDDALGETGIVMIDTGDPLCGAASLFAFGTFTVVAMTDPETFHRLLERFAHVLTARTETVAAMAPGRLWRIFGPEYASPPYLPPSLFREYVVRYDTPMVQAIQSRGGFARIHCHGKLRQILPLIAETGAVGLDPIEPPPQGDVELAEVRSEYGQKFTLFGNLEASDIEMLPPRAFAEKVRRAIDQGTGGTGRGFVLMPSACPYGRELSDRALRNYEIMVEMVEAF
jgi:uroporphyrinogen-III decarboxylase